MQRVIDPLVQADQAIAQPAITAGWRLTQAGYGDIRAITHAQKEFDPALRQKNPREMIDEEYRRNQLLGMSQL